jgi:hypothetical protein
LAEKKPAQSRHVLAVRWAPTARKSSASRVRRAPKAAEPSSWAPHLTSFHESEVGTFFERAPRGLRFYQITPTKSSNSGMLRPFAVVLRFCNPLLLPPLLPFHHTTTTIPRFPAQTLAQGRQWPAMDGDGAGAAAGAAAAHHHTRSPEDVFRDFRARRAGIVKALTTGQLAPRFSPLASSSCPMGLWMLRLSDRCFCGVRRCGEVLPDVRPR